MPGNAWQRRIQRAEELARKHPSASEILRFFALIVRSQEGLHGDLEQAGIPKPNLSFRLPISAMFRAQFSEFVTALAEKAPSRLSAALQQLNARTESAHHEMLNDFWLNVENGSGRTAEEGFAVRAFLQPYAEFVRSQAGPTTLRHTPCLCPYCNRKPGVGILRPLGDGGQRFLSCAFCLAEWEFRRLLCPGCGEEDNAKLPIYRAEDYPEVRVECCDTCKTYLKTVDLTRNGLAEPVVDEIASIPLDLWAQERGYMKLQPNILQL